MPIIAGSNEAALALQSGLMAAGFDVRAIRPPSVATRHRAPAGHRALSGRRRRSRSVSRPKSPAWSSLRVTSKMGSDPLTTFGAWDAEHVWHPFTQMQEYLATRAAGRRRAEGHYLIDDRGRRLFDGTSALWCNLLGHRVPAIDAAVADQLGRFAHTTLLGTTHPGVATLARRLVEIAPAGLNHVFFSDNGATAVEAALKIAFQYRLLTQGKDAAQHAVYLSLDNAYHGDTLGAAAVGGRRALPRHLQADPASRAEDAVAVLLSLPDRQDAGRLFDRLRRRARTGARARGGTRVRRDYSSRGCRRQRAC